MGGLTEGRLYMQSCDSHTVLWMDRHLRMNISLLGFTVFEDFRLVGLPGQKGASFIRRTYGCIDSYASRFCRTSVHTFLHT